MALQQMTGPLQVLLSVIICQIALCSILQKRAWFLGGEGCGGPESPVRYITSVDPSWTQDETKCHCAAFKTWDMMVAFRSVVCPG